MSMWKKFDSDYGVRTDGQIHLEPINLDSMPLEDLKLAENHPALHASVKLYAWIKIEATISRKKGKIENALKLEEKCNYIYNQMPKSCRW